MTRTRNMKLKGFTLIELIVAMAIIVALSCMLVPALTGFVKEAKVKAAITDARTVKESVEFSLVKNLAVANIDTTGAFNKTLYLDQNKNVSKRETELVGAFTSRSWYTYKTKGKSGSKSQTIDTLIAGALDGSFSESWKTGKKAENPLKYNKDSFNCADYVKNIDTNFGLVVVYDTVGTVRMMQLYRKGVLVTYVNGEYIANTNSKAHFIGEGTWDKIYSDCGMEAPEEICQISLKNGQIGNDGKNASWY